MIDTIVLTFKEHMFTILDHDKFNPSTEGLFNSNYYRLGSRSNMICKQNPTSKELKIGIYKPRLSVTKRINRAGIYEIILKIELSLPKLLYGNNFDELEDKDFHKIVSLLIEKLEDMGVRVSEQILIHASVSAVHYSKNIPLTDYSAPYTYLKEIFKSNINLRYDFNQTDFRNEGHSLKFRTNSLEIVFYDKIKDLLKATISDKRSEEKDNRMQLHLFEEFNLKKPFELLRMEVRLNKKQKLRQVLRIVGYEIEPNFELLFKKEIAQKILLYYLELLEINHPKLVSYNYDKSTKFLADFSFYNPKAGIKKALLSLGLKALMDEVGSREAREVLKRYGRNNWYRLFKEVKSFYLPTTNRYFSLIRTELNKFEPLKLVDFQDPRLNN